MIRARQTQQRRGSLVFGMVILIAITGTAGALMLAESLESARSTTVLERRLQVQAAAEAAVAVMEAGGLPGDEASAFDLGRHTITATQDGDVVLLAIDLNAPDGLVLETHQRRVRFTSDENGAVRFGGFLP